MAETLSKEQIQVSFEKINEARQQLKLAGASVESEVNRVLTRLIHECLTKRMSPEHIAVMAGWRVKEVRSAMRARGIEPRHNKTVLAKQSASALIDNAHLLGIEPEEMDLSSPLAYLPMGKELREFLETNPVEAVEEIVPRVEIKTQGDGPSECKVWFGERLVFDGVSRDALSQAPLDVSLRRPHTEIVAKIKAAIITGISAEEDWPGPSIKPGELSDAQIEWLAAWLAGEGVR